MISALYKHPSVLQSSFYKSYTPLSTAIPVKHLHLNPSEAIVEETSTSSSATSKGLTFIPRSAIQCPRCPARLWHNVGGWCCWPGVVKKELFLVITNATQMMGRKLSSQISKLD
ncbi:hypothetical protein PILCRDRAFT_814349 [Piloderma croceum F 1598]|uniref:Uncharacterized protein n=1 Tax=Piloderma croceum (strain F 1598) TaxID=765440 RepID=A0A0C3BPL6_PILCF|nr:hypothetical protein PILCRDRAFT_814349 [Piloderma croceum F 1598]